MGIVGITRDEGGIIEEISWTHQSGIIIPDHVSPLNDNRIMRGSIAYILSAFFGDYDEFAEYLAHEFSTSREQAGKLILDLLSAYREFLSFLREVALPLGLLPDSPSDNHAFRQLAVRFLRLVNDNYLGP